MPWEAANGLLPGRGVPGLRGAPPGVALPPGRGAPGRAPGTAGRDPGVAEVPPAAGRCAGACPGRAEGWAGRCPGVGLAGRAAGVAGCALVVEVLAEAGSGAPGVDRGVAAGAGVGAGAAAGLAGAAELAAGAGVGLAAAGLGAAAGVGAGAAAFSGALSPALLYCSRRRRTTGGSMVDEAERTNSPMSFSFDRTSLLSSPSSLASS